MIIKESIITASKDQVSCDMAGETAILNLKSGQYYGLNPIGTRIWALVQEPKTVGDILATIVAEYEVDSGQCESDLLKLLEELEAKKLIEVKNATAE